MQVGIDPRPVMREAYNLFKIGGDPEKVQSNAFDLKILDSLLFPDFLFVYISMLELKS